MAVGVVVQSGEHEATRAKNVSTIVECVPKLKAVGRVFSAPSAGEVVQLNPVHDRPSGKLLDAVAVSSGRQSQETLLLIKRCVASCRCHQCLDDKRGDVVTSRVVAQGVGVVSSMTTCALVHSIRRLCVASGQCPLSEATLLHCSTSLLRL